MKIIENKILNTVSIVIVAVIVFLGVVNGVVANSNDDRIMTGFAWSDTIGWVSFNSSDIAGSTVEYGVIIDGDTGNFSGYAWSDNIGWIDFAPTSDYPGAPNYGARLNPDGSITGWARALASITDSIITTTTTTTSESESLWIGQDNGTLQACDSSGSCTSYGDKGADIFTATVYDNKLWIGQQGGALQACDSSGSCTSYGDKGADIYTATVYDNKLWIGQDRGNLQACDSSGSCVNYGDKGKDILSSAVYDNKLWIGQERGTLQACDSSGSCTSYGTNLRDIYTTTVYDNKLWIGDGDTLQVCDSSGSCVDTGLEGGDVSAVYDNKLWIGDGDILQACDSSGSCVNYGDKGADIYVMEVYDDRLWIGQDNGTLQACDSSGSCISYGDKGASIFSAATYPAVSTVTSTVTTPGPSTSNSGWDGWINLNDDNYGVTMNQNTGAFDGYAWGSDVVGWLSFDQVTAILASEISQVTLTANPSSIVSGGSSTLTWTSYNMDTCDADWTTNPVDISGTDDVSPTTTTTYTISCSGTYGSDSSSATVTIVSGAQANNDSAEVNEFSFVNINVLGNDLGDSISVVSVTDPTHGTVVNNTTSVRYVNSVYGGGVDTFTYTIEDSFGNQDTATVVVTIYDCGDGVVQLYEECDEGGSNGVCPAGCSSSCVINDCSEAPTGDESVCGDDFCADDESFFTCPVDCDYTFEEF